MKNGRVSYETRPRCVLEYFTDYGWLRISNSWPFVLAAAVFVNKKIPEPAGVSTGWPTTGQVASGAVNRLVPRTEKLKPVLLVKASLR
jgi:hypothetical protein